MTSFAYNVSGVIGVLVCTVILLFFYCQVIFSCVDISHFIHSVVHCGHLGCFHLLIFGNNVVNIYDQLFRGLLLLFLIGK